MRIDSQPSLLKTQTQQADKGGLSERDDRKLKEACQDFEALFLSSLLKAMRKTVQKTDLFGSDSGEQTFQEMMDMEISKSAARNSSMGVADVLYKQLKVEIALNTPAVSGEKK